MAVASPLAPRSAAVELRSGAYVTDGYRLFAILSVAAHHSDALVTYEDCQSLEMLVTPLAELRGRGLELVRAAPAAANA
ncbi:MAG TPA: hypothetical protein VGI73_06800 [Solirubrobacterales bacterium]|jgi:hypothetical protein